MVKLGNVGFNILIDPMWGKVDVWVWDKISEGWVGLILTLSAATVTVLLSDSQFACNRRFWTDAAHVNDLCSALKNVSERHTSHRHKVHRLSSELRHLLQFDKFPVRELPFSVWIINRSNFIHKGGNLISWLFDERAWFHSAPQNVADGVERHFGDWRGRGTQLSRGTGVLYATRSLLWCCTLKEAFPGSKTIGFRTKLTAWSCLLSPCCARTNMDGLRWAFGRMHRVVGVLCYERLSGTCLELLSAGKVVF